MKKKYNNINPNKLHDELISNGIIPLLVESNLKLGKYIAENTWITFEDNVNVEKVNEIVAKHNPTPIVQPNEQEILSKEIANLKINNMQKDAIISNTLKTVADLKVEIMNMRGVN